MAIPHVLVLAGASPSEQHGGEIYLAEACRNYPAGRISRFAIAHPVYSRPSEWLGIPIAYVDHPREHGIQRLGRLAAMASALPLHAYIRRVLVPRLVDEAVRFAQAERPEVVWALLDSPTLMAVAWRVARRLSLPLVVSVLDPPERWTSELRFASITEKAMLGEFERSLRAACRVAVISEGMQAEYRRRFGLDSILLRHGIHPSLVQAPARQSQPGRQLIIGLAGNLYGREAQTTLFRALESTGWSIAGRAVSLRILSNSFTVQVPSHADIQFLGWRSLPETIRLLSGCDLLYLPYWFDPRLRYSAQLCFPTKLPAYLAAGRPVLVHAPFDSAPAQFLGRYAAGEVCDSLEPSDLVATCTRLLDNEVRYGSAIAAAREAIGAELGLHVFLRRFADLIGGGDELYDAMKRQAGLTGSDAMATEMV
jgi:glycosyltransferase involved in cell wall biosynthesis